MTGQAPGAFLRTALARLSALLWICLFFGVSTVSPASGQPLPLEDDVPRVEARIQLFAIDTAAFRDPSDGARLLEALGRLIDERAEVVWLYDWRQDFLRLYEPSEALRVAERWIGSGGAASARPLGLEELRSAVGETMDRARADLAYLSDRQEDQPQDARLELYVFARDFEISGGRRVLEYDIPNACAERAFAGASPPDPSRLIVSAQVFSPSDSALPESAMRTLAIAMALDPEGDDATRRLLGQSSLDCPFNMAGYRGSSGPVGGDCSLIGARVPDPRTPLACPEPPPATAASTPGAGASGGASVPPAGSAGASSGSAASAAAQPPAAAPSARRSATAAELGREPLSYVLVDEPIGVATAGGAFAEVVEEPPAIDVYLAAEPDAGPRRLAGDRWDMGGVGASARIYALLEPSPRAGCLTGYRYRARFLAEGVSRLRRGDAERRAVSIDFAVASCEPQWAPEILLMELAP